MKIKEGGGCEDRLGTGPPRARTEVIYVDLGVQGGEKTWPGGSTRTLRTWPASSPVAENIHHFVWTSKRELIH